MSTNTSKSAKKGIFSDTFQMETETIFEQDGIIQVYPLAYELGQNITSSGRTTKMKATVMVDPDGNTRIVPFGLSNRKGEKRIFHTPWAEVRESPKNLVVRIHYPKNEGRANFISLLNFEIGNVKAYLNNTKDIKEW